MRVVHIEFMDGQHRSIPVCGFWYDEHRLALDPDGRVSEKETFDSSFINRCDNYPFAVIRRWSVSDAAT